MTGEPPPRDPTVILRALNAHQVDYLVIGGLAVAAWAYERATKDTDVLVAPDDAGNDRRLHDALAELRAQPLAIETPGAAALGIRWDPIEGLERYMTAGGLLDVMRQPEGAAPYPQLRQRATVFSTDGVPAPYVGREDLIAMKLAAGRLQDLLDLDGLLHPANQQARRAQLRQVDRELLRAAGEPRGAPEPLDPCEREVDQLRQALAATAAANQLERALAARAHELREADHDNLTELSQRSTPQLPADLDAAVELAAAARELELVEAQETALMRQHDRATPLQRRARRDLARELDTVTDRAEQLHASAERQVTRLREQLAAIDRWWQENRVQAVDAIAARRELYRRDRAATIGARLPPPPAPPARQTPGPTRHAPTRPHPPGRRPPPPAR